MALIDDILNKKKKNTFYPTNEQDMQEEATNMPDIPVTKASDQDNKQPAQMVQPQQEATPSPTNKWGYSQSELDTLAKAGYTPEKLDYYLSDFDPDKGESILSRIYESSMPKPTAPDEKQIRNAKIVGTIADSLGLLSQMYTYGKGAHVEKRDYRNSASSQIAEQERNLRNIYLQQQNKYNDGLYNARLKDLLKSLDDYKNGKKGISGVVAAQKKLDQAQSQFEDKQRFAYDKLAQDQQNKDADRKIKEDNQKSLDRHRKTMEAQGWSRVADSRNRTSAYVKKMSSSGTGKNNDYQMVFSANPNDTNAQTDSFGNKVKVFEMNKGQIDRYTREALSDRDFLQKHPQFDRKTGLLGEAPKSFTEKERADIAATYMQEQYDKSFTRPPVISATATQPMKDWGQANNIRVPGWDEMLDNDNTETVEEDNSEDWNWID